MRLKAKAAAGNERELEASIEAVLRHCDLWQSRTPRGPPDVQELELEPIIDDSGHSCDAPTEADTSHELTYLGIQRWLAQHHLQSLVIFGDLS